jgi:hypothetical protein
MYYNEPDSQISHDAGTLKVRIIAYTLRCRVNAHYRQIGCPRNGLEEANGSPRYANVPSTIRTSKGSCNQICAFWTCAGTHTRTRTHGPATSSHGHANCSISGTDCNRKFIYTFPKALKVAPDVARHGCGRG